VRKVGLAAEPDHPVERIASAPSCEGRLPGRLTMRSTSPVLASVMING